MEGFPGRREEDRGKTGGILVGIYVKFNSH